MKTCSLCGSPESINRKIMEGADICICKECFNICREEFEELEFDTNPASTFKLSMKPHELVAKLDEFIIGQAEAKEILSVAIYDHYKRINSKSKTTIQKTNIMLQGPTGSGKTYIMQCLAKVLNLPLVIVDATTFTEAGYIGGNVEDILKKLYFKAGKNQELAERGIVYIDEVDKLKAKSGDGERDVNGLGVQQALLKIIEDSEVVVPIKEGMEKVELVMNTRNILFVAGGAFEGIDKIIKARLTPSKSGGTIGFTPASAVKVAEVEISKVPTIIQADLLKFGFAPEFVGRIPIIARIEKLSKEELKDILTKPKDAIVKQYKELLKLDGVKISFANEALDYIVDEAEKTNLGARGLKGVIDKQMNHLMFELPKYSTINKVIVTKRMLQGTKKDVEELVKTSQEGTI